MKIGARRNFVSEAEKSISDFPLFVTKSQFVIAGLPAKQLAVSEDTAS
jgi:hypothetical protein